MNAERKRIAQDFGPTQLIAFAELMHKELNVLRRALRLPQPSLGDFLRTLADDTNRVPPPDFHPATPVTEISPRPRELDTNPPR